MLNDTVQKNGNTIVTTNARSVRIEARMPASSLRIGPDLARIASVPGLDDAPGGGGPSTAGAPRGARGGRGAATPEGGMTPPRTTGPEFGRSACPRPP